VEKGPDAFRTISEVADDLDLPQHVLRFWETRFGQIRPMKRGGGRRYYRPDDVDLLRGIRHLLYDEGYTINGVQRILRERGVRQVQAVGQAVMRLSRTSAAAVPDEGDGAPAKSGAFAGIFDFLPALRGSRADAVPELPRSVDIPLPAEIPDPEFPENDLAPTPFLKSHAPEPDHGPRTAPRSDASLGGSAALSPEAVRALRAALHDLADCRRLLDTVQHETS
jgi:DNA-binding transcriptional MerR regulator